MVSNLYFSVIILSTVTFSGISGQHFIERKTNGDLLTGADLNCTVHGANQVSNGTCVCSGSGSYFTNRNGTSKCFKFRGEEELGCTIYPENDDRKRIFTVDPKKGEVSYMTSNKPQCTPKYRGFFIWKNGTWEPYSYEGIVGAASKSKTDASGTTVKQLGLVYNLLNTSQIALISGNLFRFNFTLCGEPSCFMFKYEGKKPWDPITTTTTTTTTTTSTTTTTPPTPTINETTPTTNKTTMLPTTTANETIAKNETETSTSTTVVTTVTKDIEKEPISGGSSASSLFSKFRTKTMCSLVLIVFLLIIF